MNILELDSFKLADAVKFNDQLNPRIWDGEKMRPEVREKLLAIAADFQESLGVNNLDVEDITVSGSNAGFTYTPHSDIDLHLVVRMPDECDEVYQELFNAKKYQYNDEHDIRIGGYDVELYVQPADQPHVSAGVYSVSNDDWIHIPRKIAAQVNDESVRNKYEDVKARIDSVLKSNDIDRMQKMWDKIKEMRRAGLAKNGELGPENLAFKMLRTQGDLGKLKDAIRRARDAELSLTERRKKKKKPRVKYGFGGYWYPGFGFSAGETSDVGAGDGGGGESRMSEDVTLTPDGVSASTKMFLSEKPVPNQTEIIFDFMKYAVHELGLHNIPVLKIKKDPQWSVIHKSFGRYRDDLGQIELAVGNRHIMDVLRTLAHELQHRKQDQREHMPPEAGATGSRFENEAHAVAGVLMRNYAELHPEYFEDVPVNEASGYIPTRAQAQDPRFKMALTVDVHPGETGKQANKMALKTDAQGKPGLLMKTANLIKEDRKTRDINQAPGPETPPTMPAGTVRIDVSDMYDWYKLGQHISNMKGLGKHDFGAGPPSSIISFGDEETEHKFIKDLEATGLDVTDIDPKDPAQPADMRKIKTDPTYNVDEDIVESLRQEFALLEDDYLNEIRMSTANLRQEAAKTGALAGMEFEMILPNVETDVEPEYEPDYDQDQRARSFGDVRDFFHDGDYNGRRDVDRLIEEIDEEYQEWKQDQTAEAWARDGADYVRDYVANNDLFDRDEAMAQARDEIIDANPDLPQESEEFTELLSARLNEMETEFADTAFEDRGRIHDAAFEEFSEMQDDEYDEGSFLDDKYPYMTDIQNNFDISWPYYYDLNDGQDGEMDVDRVADEFSSYMKKPVNASSSYHGARREAGHYVVEPDGSLEGDNSGDGGLEFVSPPMPIDEMISDLNKVKAWAGDIGAYTNDSTGLHINISVPNYSLDKLDYVKLALLMGDEYVLEEFGRMSNTYTKAATGKIRDALRKNPDLAPAMMDKMRGHMEDLATKAIHSGTTDKYTSINTKTGYIEFRSPGGDWLDENFDKIENTLLRFTVAMDAAMNPEKYRQEYLKKLYKLLASSQEKGGVDVLQLFANYSAGELDKAALIRQVREKQLARNVEKGNTPKGQKYWWSVTNPANTMASIEVVATSKEEAIATAVKPENYPDWARVQNTLRATPLRPYQEPEQKPTGPTLNGRPSNHDGNYVIVDIANEQTPVYRYMAANGNDALLVLRQWIAANPGTQWNFKFDPTQLMGQPVPQSAAQPAQTGNWGIWITNADRFARAPGQLDNTVLRRFSSREAAEQWIAQTRAERPDLRTDIEVREIEPTQQPAASQDNWSQDFERRMQQPVQQTAAGGEFTGQWQIMFNGEELTRIAGIGNNQADANRVGRDYVLQQIRSGRLSPVEGAEIEVLPVMS